jgi:uncharacterized protein YdhG (YjbR/CyaY superfamily)
MPSIKFTTTEEYISSFSTEIQDKLISIQNAIREAIPDAIEQISYNIPAFKIGKKWIIYFSAYKEHLSISMPPSRWSKHFEKELKDYKVSVSTVQFPYSESIPLELIQQIAIFKSQEK